MTDRDGEAWQVGIERGALHATRQRGSTEADVHLESTHAGLAALVRGSSTLDELEADRSLTVTADRAALIDLLACLDQFDMLFPIMTR